MGTSAREIADQLEEEIKSGQWLPGSKLPTHRELAQRTGVALNTASLAMKHLVKRGLISGEVGRGSFVRAASHIDKASFRIERDQPDLVNLSYNVMPLPGLTDLFETAAHAVLRRERALLADYQPHAGRSVDRVLGATWLARHGHLPNDPSRIMICAGAQHAVTVALLATAKSGGLLAVEAFTWPGIKACAEVLGIEIVPVPMDHQGIKPGALLRLAAQRRLSALYCMPALHNPTGVVLSKKRRDAIAAIARRLDFQIIEDDAYGFLTETEKDGHPSITAPLAALAPERTWYIRSTSKSLTPGLRASWLLVPPGESERATNIIRATVWTAPPLGAAIASLWVGDGTAKKIEADKRQEAFDRQKLARSMLNGCSEYSHPCSMHLWVGLPIGVRPQKIAELATSHGVRVTPGEVFGISSAPNRIRLAIGAPLHRRHLTFALEQLSRLW